MAAGLGGVVGSLHVDQHAADQTVIGQVRWIISMSTTDSTAREITACARNPRLAHRVGDRDN